jgi:hypothetical protein
MITLGEWHDQWAAMFQMPAYLELIALREDLIAQIKDVNNSDSPQVITQDRAGKLRRRLDVVRVDIQAFLDTHTPPRPTC